MIDPQGVVVVVTWLSTLGLVLASWALERRYIPLRRRETERVIAMFGYYRVPLVTRILATCWHRQILWLGLINAGWHVFWWLRCEERRMTFALEGRRHSIVAPIGALITMISITSFPLGCRTGGLVVAFSFALTWSCAILAAYALEARVPRPHRERELVVTVGASVLAQTCLAPFLVDPWDNVVVSGVQLLVGARLLVPEIRRALVGAETTAFYEAVYESGAPLCSAREALQTPLEAPFLVYCEENDPEGARAYKEAVDRENGAVVEGPCTKPHAAARALERHWPGFVAHRAALPTSRRYYDLDESSGDEEDDDEEEVQYVSLSEMKEVE